MASPLSLIRLSGDCFEGNGCGNISGNSSENTSENNRRNSGVVLLSMIASQIEVLKRLSIFVLATGAMMTLTNCTSLTSLSSLEAQNRAVVTKIAQEDQGGANTPVETPSAASAPQIVGSSTTKPGENTTSSLASTSASAPPPLSPVSSAEIGRNGRTLTSLKVPTSIQASSESAATAAMQLTSTQSIDPVALPGRTQAPVIMQPDPVALPKPPTGRTSAATSLSSVPLTPVENRPTNQIMMVRTTAYTHSESDHLKYGRQTAAGNTLQYGSRVRSAAADWSKYPVGTRFMIEGLPYEYVVDDYGSALVGTETIDIYKPERETMNEWGVRNVPIRVLQWGSVEESRRILEGRKGSAEHVRKMLREIEKKGKSGSLAFSS